MQMSRLANIGERESRAKEIQSDWVEYYSQGGK